eukprot:COSAG01_NODE_3118_length_6562_cov_343.759554_5_plen_228_part_00
MFLNWSSATACGKRCIPAWFRVSFTFSRAADVREQLTSARNWCPGSINRLCIPVMSMQLMPLPAKLPSFKSFSRACKPSLNLDSSPSGGMDCTSISHSWPPPNPQAQSNRPAPLWISQKKRNPRITCGWLALGLYLRTVPCTATPSFFPVSFNLHLSLTRVHLLPERTTKPSPRTSAVMSPPSLSIGKHVASALPCRIVLPIRKSSCSPAGSTHGVLYTVVYRTRKT